MQVRCENQKVQIPAGSTALDLAQQLNFSAPHQALAAYINGELKDAGTELFENDAVKFVSFAEKEGREIFWHSSAHVLAQAVKRLWPEAVPTIGPPIDQGFYYDFANLDISENDFAMIEKEAKKIIAENYRPEKIVFKNEHEAALQFGENKYKKELIEEYKKNTLTAYKQGDFIDLCRGPHIPYLSKIKAFKVLKTSGAYWRGDAKNEMLTRIYAISFPEKKELSGFLKMLEEAQKRDHRKLGRELDLFSVKEEAPGMPFIHPKGMIVWNALLSFMQECIQELGYQEIKTPILMSQELWERSGHWFHYKENMYTCHVDENEYAVKPMNCPGCMLYYLSRHYSYRELPLKISEIGLVHRHELSGSLNGMFRVRAFHQDDAHVFMEKKDIKEQILELLNLADKIYMTFGLSYKLELSTRPEKEKTIGSDEDWEIATGGLKDALEEWGHSYRINEGDGAFYGPKIDLHIKDALGRYWQCGTIQLDMSLPEKFKLEYTASSGERLRPVMLHRALYGSVERFLGILIEHFAGKFPLWLSPLPIAIIPVADRHFGYAEKAAAKIREKGFICEIDDSHESVSKKIRSAQLQKANYMLTLGDIEEKNQTVALRTRDGRQIKDLTLDDFLARILKEKDQRQLLSVFAAKQEEAKNQRLEKN